MQRNFSNASLDKESLRRRDSNSLVKTDSGLLAWLPMSRFVLETCTTEITAAPARYDTTISETNHGNRCSSMLSLRARDGWHRSIVGGTAVTVCLSIHIKITCHMFSWKFRHGSSKFPSHEKSPLVVGDRAHTKVTTEWVPFPRRRKN